MRKPLSKEEPAQLISRSDHSKANTDLIRLIHRGDKKVRYGDKGYFGTPLPLIPDIRRCEVEDGIVGKLLQAFGVKKSFNRKVTLFGGPNHRKNRYLRIHYTRLIQSIGGEMLESDSYTPAHVNWKNNYYKIDLEKLTRKERKLLKKNSRRYWGIANQLLLKSTIFRAALPAFGFPLRLLR
jgi:hypothetical protein